MKYVDMDISIAIANWNLSDLLRECLNSVYANVQGIETEVIVVDNGSTDNSVDMIKKTFPDVRLIRNTKNVGFNVATNQAVEASRGRYVLLLNNDTVVTPGTLAQLVEYMDAHPGVGIVGPKLVYPDGRLQWSCHHFETLSNALWMALFLYRLFPRSEIFGRYNMTYWDYNDTREVDWLMATCMLVRREAISEVGLLRDEGFAGGADADWCFRFWQHGWSVVYYHQAIVVHHHGKSSIAYDGDKAVDWRAQSILEAFLSNAGLFSRRHNRFELRLYIAIRKLGAAIRFLLWLIVYIFSNKKFSAKARLKGQWMILKASFPNA